MFSLLEFPDALATNGLILQKLLKIIRINQGCSGEEYLSA
jgi:hypothetical protein